MTNLYSCDNYHFICTSYGSSTESIRNYKLSNKCLLSENEERNGHRVQY